MWHDERVNAVETETTLKDISIGLVMRTFTGAAYSGYYSFFSNPNLNARSFLIRSVPSATSMKSTVIYALQNEGFSSSQIHVIDDRVVHRGNIFTPEGLPKYDVLLFVHNEYVTLEEYHNVARFVKAGGNVIILNGNAFFGEVDYNEETNQLALLAGHGWEFDGENGTRMDIYKSRFLNTKSTFEHFDWIGSRYQTFRAGTMQGAVMNDTGNNPHPVATELVETGHSVIGQGYSSYEENTVITPNVHTIATWRSSFQHPDRGIRIYEKFPFGPYGGSIIHIGIFSVSLSGGAYSHLNNNAGLRAFLKQAILHQKGLIQRPWIKYPYDGGIFSDKNIPVAFNPQNVTGTYLNGTGINLKPGDTLKGLEEGAYNLTVTYGNLSRTVVFKIDRSPPMLSVNNEQFNANQTFSTGQWVNVTATDPSINYLRGYVHDDIHSLEWGRQLISSGEDTNLSMSYRVQGNGTKTMFVQAIDGAGNTVTRWIRLNPNGTFAIAPQTMPVAKAINSTHAMVSIPPFPNGTYVELQVGNVWTQEWTNFPFVSNGTDPNNSTATAIFPHEGRNLLYRVAARVGNRTGYYYSIQKFPGSMNILWLECKEKTGNLTRLTIGMLRQPFSNYSIVGLTYQGNMTSIENVSKTMLSENSMRVELPTEQLDGIQFLMLSGRHNYSIPLHLNSTLSRSYYIHPLTQTTSQSTTFSTSTSTTSMTETQPITSIEPTTSQQTDSNPISQTTMSQTDTISEDFETARPPKTKVITIVEVTTVITLTSTPTSSNRGFFAVTGIAVSIITLGLSIARKRRPGTEE